MSFNNINEELDNIYMDNLSKKINSKEYQEYFVAPSGREHYRLLSYISLNNENINILDVGTYKGSSALAFSINPSNNVFSFDISDSYDLNNRNGITFKHGYVNTHEHKTLILSCSYILLDTMHDGTFEKSFFDFLIDINYKGALILDDIHLNNEMIEFWNGINKEKEDITFVGHSTGTGLVTFD